MKKIILWIRFNILSLIITRPTSFSWTVDDFNKLRSWARCQRHPFSKDLTLWDMIEEKDSTLTLSAAEKYLKETL
jgi:hypothetical protein